VKEETKSISQRKKKTKVESDVIEEKMAIEKKLGSVKLVVIEEVAVKGEIVVKSESTQRRRNAEVPVMIETTKKLVAPTKIDITLMIRKKVKIVTEVVNLIKNRRTVAISITMMINVNVGEMMY